MNIKLIKLIISNFMGIHSFELNADGKDIKISAENRKGKTTILRAVWWLLFGKNETGDRDFTIRPTDLPIECEPEVTLVLDVNGTQHEYKKTMTSKLNKETQEYTEGATKYLIDGVPKKPTEFQTEINKVIDEQTFKLLTSSTYFNETLEWKDRRKLLFDMVGSKTDVEIAESNTDFQELVPILTALSYDDNIKKYKNQKSESKAILENIQPRIDENAKKIDNSINADEINKELASLNAEYSKLLESRAKQSVCNTADIEKEINDITNKIYDIERKNKQHINGINDTNNKLHNEYADKVQEIQLTIDKCKRKLSLMNNERNVFESQRQSLATEYNTVKGNAWNGDIMCPTCHRELPIEQIDSLKAEFNKAKSIKLKDIAQQGTSIKSQLISLDERIAKGNSAVLDYTGKLKALNDNAPTYAEPTNMVGYDVTIAQLKSQLQSLADKKIEMLNSTTDTTDIDNKIADVKAKIDEANAQLNVIANNKACEERIEQLQAQRVQARNSNVQATKILDLLEAFTRYKCNSLTDSINSMFKFAKFKLFSPNKTKDGIQECCEAIFNGSNEYKSINTEGKVTIGLDIINAFSKFYGHNIFTFIDNIDSLDTNNLKKLVNSCNQQIICLMKSDDKEFKVEEIVKESK